MFQFKILKASEIDTITSMMRDFYAIDNYPIDVEVSKKLFHEFISDEKLGKCWLIYNNEALVGYVILTFIFSFEHKGKIAFLDELYIKEIARGIGIGRQTIEFIKQQALINNVKLLYLEVENHNEKAQKLYLSSNFEVHNRKLLKHKLF